MRFPIDFEDAEAPDVYDLTNRKVSLNNNGYFRRGGTMILTMSLGAFNPDTDKYITLPNGTQVWICDYIPVSTPPSTPLPPSSPSDETTISSEMRINCANLEIKPTGLPKELTVNLYNTNTGEIFFE